MMIPNARFELSAPAIARWAVVRLAAYLTVAVITVVLFVAGAAFYSFVWPAPPQTRTPAEQSIPPSLPRTPSLDPGPASDPDDAMRKSFSPIPVDAMVVSRLSSKLVYDASIISFDSGSRILIGRVSDASFLKSVDGSDFLLQISTNSTAMDNSFGLRTPHNFKMRASDLRWYAVRYSPADVKIYAVVTNAQANAAMAREIR